ncbi:hypothetical protein ANO11243_007350 [Dothideomycetidae sp. 11243]|nr:hypothetical protein ANO11243_007350 [fungal sp. No.11243]
MPMLKRDGAARLLRTVNGAQHASKDDHEKKGNSRGSSLLSDVPRDFDNEDFTRDPDSSSDSGAEAPEPGLRSAQGRLLKDNSSVKNPTKATFKTSRAGTKRKQQERDTNDQPEWLMSSQQSRRSKSGFTYGSASQRSSKETLRRPLHSLPPDEQPSKPTFKRPKNLEHSLPGSSQPEPSSSQRSFARPRAAIPDLWSDDTLESSRKQDELPSSPPGFSSPAPSSDIEEVFLDGPNPADYEPCPVCAKSVAKSFKSDWEMDNCNGRRMNLKMQEKFCRAHRAHEARDTWKQRKYPELDWTALPKRLTKLKSRIDRILDNKVPSSFRDEFQASVKENSSRTVMKAWESESNKWVRAGYYGSKGAKMMSDYSLKTFDKKLSRLAGQDKSLATASVAGGVSGFVQAVVVPELALALIMEDMGTDAEEARTVLDQSTELGNMLNSEEDEHLPVRAHTPPPTYAARGARMTQK